MRKKGLLSYQTEKYKLSQQYYLTILELDYLSANDVSCLYIKMTEKKSFLRVIPPLSLYRRKELKIAYVTPLVGCIPAPPTQIC